MILLADPACDRLCFCTGAAQTSSLFGYVFVHVTNRFIVPTLLKVPPSAPLPCRQHREAAEFVVQGWCHTQSCDGIEDEQEQERERENHKNDKTVWLMLQVFLFVDFNQFHVG